MSLANKVMPFCLDIDSADRAQLHERLDAILDSGTLILGSYTKQFEQAFADFTGSAYAVSFNSCTSALEVQLRLEGVASAEVAVPTNTNFATVAAVIHAGGVPVFMDMDSSTFAPSLEHVIEAHHAHPALSGVLWVHVGGVISPDVPRAADYCRQHGLFFLEDCAHAHGSMIDGKHAGAYGSSGAFSFFPTKVMTTMEGGMIVTNRANDVAVMRSMRNQGKRDGDYNAMHVDLGSSWRISEFSAAFGLIQLAKLPKMLECRNAVATAYMHLFDELGIEYVSTTHMERASNYKVIAVLPDFSDLAKVKDAYRKRGIILGGGVYEVPCHKQPVFLPYVNGNQVFPVSEAYCSRQLGIVG